MLAIHDSPGSFSDRWISYCEQRAIPYRRVNCLASDVVEQCRGADAVLWHWDGRDPVNFLVARQIIASLEASGLRVFPNVKTCWHYDDKVAQKYLLEAIGAPLIPTWVFLDPDEAMQWIAEATWPKVFKLRCGAGSSNVRLVRSPSEARALCKQAFGRGFPAVAAYFTDMQTRLRKSLSTHDFCRRVARAPRTLAQVLEMRRKSSREQGYFYLQEFLPENTHDTRITIIGERAFGYRRMNRPNDFRASGSGRTCYDPELIDRRCIEIAFKVADQLGSQSMAFDFLFDSKQEPMIGEISYCYVASMVHDCPGYWDRQGMWHPGPVWPQDAVIDDLLVACR